MFPKLFLAAIVIVSLLLGIASGVWGWQKFNTVVVIVEWSTATELDTVGFNLYRSLQPDGDYIQINAQLIPASSDPLTGGEYTYSDATAVPNTLYYYLLEDVDINGSVTPYGPIEVQSGPRSWVEFILATVFFGVAFLGTLNYFRMINPNKGA